MKCRWRRSNAQGLPGLLTASPARVSSIRHRHRHLHHHLHSILSRLVLLLFLEFVNNSPWSGGGCFANWLFDLHAGGQVDWPRADQSLSVRLPIVCLSVTTIQSLEWDQYGAEEEELLLAVMIPEQPHSILLQIGRHLQTTHWNIYLTVVRSGIFSNRRHRVNGWAEDDEGDWLAW